MQRRSLPWSRGMKTLAALSIHDHHTGLKSISAIQPGRYRAPARHRPFTPFPTVEIADKCNGRSSSLESITCPAPAAVAPFPMSISKASKTTWRLSQLSLITLVSTLLVHQKLTVLYLDDCIIPRHGLRPYHDPPSYSSCCSSSS